MFHIENLEGRLLLAAMTLHIDPAQSFITVAGAVAGSPIEQQGLGSLTARYGGTIKVDLTDTDIRFINGGSINAHPSGNWQPGAAPADYGVRLTADSTVIMAAVRNVIFDVASNTLPIVDGQFSTGGQMYRLVSGRVDFAVGVFTSSIDLPTDTVVSNAAAAFSTISNATGEVRLTIPVSLSVTYSVLGEQDSTFTFTGQLVASSSGPDSSIVLSQKGFLTITGTEENDTIAVRRSGNTVLAEVNGQVHDFSAAAVKRVIVAALGGNDHVNVSSLRIPTRLDGGAGNDSLRGGFASDTILGGDGNDVILGNAGNDSLDGGNGNDTIFGGFGNDRIIGGNGRDSLFGEDGDDEIIDRDGLRDVLDGGAGQNRARADKIDILRKIQSLLK